MMETKQQVVAKKQKNIIVDEGNFILVRPSLKNMHTFVAEEDSCFFDICLPNYSTASQRKMTYFKEIGELEQISENRSKVIINYETTPPKLPHGFEIADLSYVGKMDWT